MLEVILTTSGYDKKKPAADGEDTARKDTVDDYKEKEDKDEPEEEGDDVSEAETDN